MSDAAFSSNMRNFYLFICVSASTSPTEKLAKFTTRSTSNEEEILCSANEEVSCRPDLRRPPENMKPSSLTELLHQEKAAFLTKACSISGLRRLLPPDRPSGEALPATSPHRQEEFPQRRIYRSLSSAGSFLISAPQDLTSADQLSQKEEEGKEERSESGSYSFIHEV